MDLWRRGKGESRWLKQKVFHLDFDADTVFDELLTYREFEKQVPTDLRAAHKEVWGDENPADCFPLVFGMIDPELLKNITMKQKSD